MIKKVILLVLLLSFTVIAADLITFDEFIQKFKKDYKPGTPEYVEKKQIFDYNIEQLNKKNCTVCGVTKFFDIPPADFEKKTLTLQILDAPVSSALPSEISGGPKKLSAPRSIDWRQRGIITTVKDQGSCGCCWAFASIALAETNLIMKGLANQNVDLSQQYLLKCTPEGDCQGGYIQNALKKVVTYGVPYQSKYPYSPKTKNSGICLALSNTKISDKKPLSYYDIDDNQIKQLLTTGPLAIAIDSTNWQYYTGGIWKGDPNGNVNHAVILVGYTADGKSWIVKNQWGTDWGQNGYIFISTDRKYNCKIGTALHMLSQINIKLFAFFGLVLFSFFF